VHWIYLGAESVFFYPLGLEQEHLVVDDDIPSVDMRWQVMASCMSTMALQGGTTWRTRSF
jgi:hypothetical protein